MTDLPKTVQWILDFLNINSTPGNPNPYRLPYELRKLKREPKPKEIERTNLTIETNRIIEKTTGKVWRIKYNKPEDTVNFFELERQVLERRAEREKFLKELEKKYPSIRKVYEKRSELMKETVLKQNDSEVIKKLKSKDIKIEFEGINNAPTLEDYKKFFLEKGIPPYKGKDLLLENGKPLSSLDIKSYNNRPKNNSEPGFYDYYEDNPRIEYTFRTVVAETRSELFRILSNMVWGTKTYENEGTGYESLRSYMRQIIDLYLECWKEDEVPAADGKTSWGTPYRGRYTMVIDSMQNKEPFPHYGRVTHALYACIMDFGINHKELHQYLRQCLHCGRFWRLKKKRGRPEKFCSDVCRERHDDQPREANKKSVETTRKHQKPKKQKEDYKTLAEYLKQKEHPEKEAEEIAQEWVYTYGKSFKEYKRTQGVILKGL